MNLKKLRQVEKNCKLERTEEHLLSSDMIKIKSYDRKDLYNIRKIENASFCMIISLFMIFNAVYWSIFILL